MHLRFFPLFVVGLLTVLPIAAGAQPCEGDVDGDRAVSVDELITAVDNSLHGCLPVEPRFVDNGDGTISDELTGLMWEKKEEGENCLHCWVERYSWGYAMSEWLSQLNGSLAATGLGGFNDWRVPSVEELESILDCTLRRPCLHPTFGPSGTSCFWTNASFEDYDAITVDFAGAGIINLPKGSTAFVRAVRGSMQR